MAKKYDESGGLGQYEDGHWLLYGARWHTPKEGAPTECEVTGCDKVLGAWRNYDALDGIDANPPDEPESDAAPEPVLAVTP